MKNNNTNWKRVPEILAGVGIGTAIVLLVDKMAMRWFLNLTIRGNYHNLKRNKKDEERINEEANRLWVSNQKYKSVTIHSHDHLTLAGRYLKNEKAKRCVLLFHGWRGAWNRDFGDLPKFLYENDCSVLIVDQRGQGNSKGTYMGFGVLERKDCVSWVDFVTDELEKNTPLYLLGVSMGASSVLMASGENLPKQVKGIVADCGFTSPNIMVKNVAKEKMHVKSKLIMERLNRTCRRKAGYRLDEYTTLEALEKNTRPILFVHGLEDDFVPYEMTLENYKVCNTHKSLLLVENAGHCKAYTKNPAAYQLELINLFKEGEKDIGASNTKDNGILKG